MQDDQDMLQKIQVICAYANAALTEDYVDKAQYNNYMNAFEKLFSDQIPSIDEKTKRDIRDIAAQIYLVYDVTYDDVFSSAQEQTLKLSNCINDLLQHMKRDPNYIRTKQWTIASMMDPGGDENDDRDPLMENVAIDQAISETSVELDEAIRRLNEESSQSFESDNSEDDMTEDEDPEIDVDALSLELNEAIRRLDSVGNLAFSSEDDSDGYTTDESDDTVDLSKQIGVFEKKFYRMLKTFQQQIDKAYHLDVQPVSAVSFIMVGVIKNLMSLPELYFKDGISLEALEAFAPAYVGIIDSWVILCNKKPECLLKDKKSTDIVALLQALKSNLSELLSDTKSNIDGPSENLSVKSK